MATKARFLFHAQTTDQLILFGATGGSTRFRASTLPGGRGMGEPVRLMIDLPNEAGDCGAVRACTSLSVDCLVASSAGDGFVVPEGEIVAQTRSGKQVLNVKGDVVARICKPVSGRSRSRRSGENRKVLVFPLDELPEMARGKGVRLQKYKDGGLSDLDDLHTRRRAVLARSGRADPDRDRLGRMARQARRRRAYGAARLSAR